MNKVNVYEMSFGGILMYVLKRFLLLVAKLAGLKGVCQSWDWYSAMRAASTSLTGAHGR